MLHTPYIRYRTSNLELDGISAPVFPVYFGGEYHAKSDRNTEYISLNRRYGTTSIVWATKSIKKTKRDAIWTFWDTTLDSGFHDVTLIDNRGRFLFESSWNTWREKWIKKNGGVFSVDYVIESPVVWTPPSFGAFLSTTNSLTNHNLSGDDINVSDGVMTLKSSDNNIIRGNGYALVVSANVGSALTGATGTVRWRASDGNPSYAIFCQFRAPQLTSPLHLAEMIDLDGARYSLRLHQKDASDNFLTAQIDTGAQSNFITKADTNYVECDVDTWYDACISYDAHTDKYALFYTKAQDPTTENFSVFLDGLSDIEDGIAQTESNDLPVSSRMWETVYLLRETAVNTISTGTAYIQNVFFIDDYMSAVDFNQLRRLCYLWNSKTTGVWPA